MMSVHVELITPYNIIINKKNKTTPRRENRAQLYYFLRYIFIYTYCTLYSYTHTHTHTQSQQRPPRGHDDINIPSGIAFSE